MTLRSTIIVPASLRDAANQLAVQIGVDPEAKLNTLSVVLVPASGADDAEATHYACSGIPTDEQRASLESAIPQFPGTAWWRTDDAWKLVASYDGQHVGESWSWTQCLNALSLKSFHSTFT